MEQLSDEQIKEARKEFEERIGVPEGYGFSYKRRQWERLGFLQYHEQEELALLREKWKIWLSVFIELIQLRGRCLDLGKMLTEILDADAEWKSKFGSGMISFTRYKAMREALKDADAGGEE